MKDFLNRTEPKNGDIATTEILRDFELTIPDKILSEKELLDYLSEAIAYMIEHKLDFLLSLLYRLDIDEDKINKALLPGNSAPANTALAHLVLERQDRKSVV